MARYNAVKSNKLQWIVTFFMILVLTAGFVAITVMFVKKDSVKTLTATNYEIGEIADTGKAVADSDGAVRTKEFINADGLKIELGKDATVTYAVFFYDEEKVLVSVVDNLSTNYYGVVPKEAKYAKVEITPTADEDGKVSAAELKYYTAQVTVSYNK